MQRQPSAGECIPNQPEPLLGTITPLHKCDDNALEVILRKLYTTAPDLPIATSNQSLLGLGMTNAFEELWEAHLKNQYLRLSKTPAGSGLVTRLHIAYRAQEQRVILPEACHFAHHVRRFPNNMRKAALSIMAAA